MKYVFRTMLLVLICLAAPCAYGQSASQPNVIIILTDDQGYGDVGFNGCTDIPTPNIDRIAKNGMVFSLSLIHI